MTTENICTKRHHGDDKSIHYLLILSLSRHLPVIIPIKNFVLLLRPAEMR